MAEQAKGLTLMEVVLALGIIGFALLTMVGVYASGLRLMTRGEELTGAAEVGRQLLDNVRRAGFGYVPDGTVAFDGRLNQPSDPATGFPPGPYPGREQYKLVVSAATLDARMKSVTATVYYDEASSVVLQTYLRP